MGITNRAPYDSFMLQAQGQSSAKNAIFKNINFKYPENLQQAIKITGDEGAKGETTGRHKASKKVLKLPDHQFKRGTQVYRSRHKRYLRDIQADKKAMSKPPSPK